MHLQRRDRALGDAVRRVQRRDAPAHILNFLAEHAEVPHRVLKHAQQIGIDAVLGVEEHLVHVRARVERIVD